MTILPLAYAVVEIAMGLWGILVLKTHSAVHLGHDFTNASS
jgi:hypothetical protein